MSQFYPLQITEVKKLTNDAVSIQFQIPSNLSKEFEFRAGMYVNLQATINGEKVVRSYSISSAPSAKNVLEVGVKRVEGGKMSTWLNGNLPNSLDVSAPMGNFGLKTMATHIMIAGGSGITPMISMIEEVLQNTRTQIYLYYSNKSKSDTMYLEKLENLVHQYPNRLNIKWVFTREGHERFSVEWLQKEFSAIADYKNAAYYACGPNGIIQSVQQTLEQMGVSMENYAREYFSAKDESEMHAANVAIGNASPLQKGQKAKVKIQFEGQKYEFECGYNEKILDAALDAGAEPPYSCMVAACCTCRAILKNGEVEMLDKDSLSDKEIAMGYVLTCQALPRTTDISLDYDV